jgi:hypothetical protein
MKRKNLFRSGYYQYFFGADAPVPLLISFFLRLTVKRSFGNTVAVRVSIRRSGSLHKNMSRLRTLLLYNIIYCLPLRSLIHEFKAAGKNMMLWGRGGNMNCNAVHMRSIFPPADLYTP